MSRAATSRLKVNPMLGLRPSLENHRIGDLNIDTRYQRSIEGGPSQTLIRKIAMFWDWSLFNPLTVARRADGTLWVVDGQHRLAAARLRNDLYDLPCVVTPYHNVEDEAASFVAMNVQRRALNAIDLFKAGLAAGDETSTVINGLIEVAGLSLAPHSNFTTWKPGMISNIAGVRESFKRYGGPVTLRALRTLAQAFNGQVLRYGGTIFGGLAVFYADVAGDTLFDEGLFIDLIAGASQKEWVADIEVRRADDMCRRPVAAAKVFRAAYDEAVACDEDMAA